LFETVPYIRLGSNRELTFLHINYPVLRLFSGYCGYSFCQKHY